MCNYLPILQSLLRGEEIFVAAAEDQSARSFEEAVSCSSLSEPGIRNHMICPSNRAVDLYSRSRSSSELEHDVGVYMWEAAKSERLVKNHSGSKPPEYCEGITRQLSPTSDCGTISCRKSTAGLRK
jgi:hypothetical protein